jgi:hypothetical protein
MAQGDQSQPQELPSFRAHFLLEDDWLVLCAGCHLVVEMLGALKKSAFRLSSCKPSAKHLATITATPVFGSDSQSVLYLFLCFL